jgi:Fe-S cluster biogenesis protein NfuA
MKPLRRRLATLVATALAALVVAVLPAGADPTGGANNVVIVQNTTDGATVARAHTQVVPVPIDTVTSANIAAAVNAGCTGCHSSAVAVQIAILEGSPSTFTPANVAVATNGGCESCGAYAYARQYWIQTSGPANLDGAARAQIAELRQEISAVAASILPSDAVTDPSLSRDFELDAKLNALTDQLIQVVTDGLQDAGATVSPVVDRTELGTPSS